VTEQAPAWIDADAHILEPRAVWERLDREFRNRVQITSMTDDQAFADSATLGYDVSLDGFPIPIWRRGTRAERFQLIFPKFTKKYSPGAGTRPERYLKDMDIEGLAQVVIYPTVFLWAPWIPQLGAAFSQALARAYNDWLHDFCAGADPKRLKAVAVLSLHDVEGAIREAKRCSDLGFVGVFVRPNPLYGRTLGHPDYHPLYRVLEDLQLPLGIHEGQLSYLPTLGVDRTDSQAGTHCMSHPFEQMSAMLSLIEGRVFDKFPKMNVLFLEAGTPLWVPYWLNRIDAERKLYRGSGEEGTLPSEIFQRQCFVTCEVDDPFLPQTIACMGDKRLLMSTDYPHMESPFPHSVRKFMEQPISAESRTRIGSSNVKTAYPRL
jgi:predicted TIM-barrel fold metal-dependent hydrolase